jgi:hypothetical protein
MIVGKWWTPETGAATSLPVLVEADDVGGIDIHVDPGKPSTHTLTVDVDDGWVFIRQFTRALVAAERRG